MFSSSRFLEFNPPDLEKDELDRNEGFRVLLWYSHLGLVSHRAVHSDGVKSVVHLLAEHVHDIDARLTGRTIAVILAPSALTVPV